MDDKKLWLEEISSVTPLKKKHYRVNNDNIVNSQIGSRKISLAGNFNTHSKHTPKAHSKPKDNILKQMLNTETEQQVDVGFCINYTKGGGQKNRLKSLAQNNKLPYDNMKTIDLHGFTISEAKDKLYDIFSYAKADNTKYIRIIHGKGEAKLKSYINSLLPNVDFITAAYSIMDISNQSGAVLVSLKIQSNY